jgi:hypothetical protein
MDNLKLELMRIPLLRELLRSDSIHINVNISEDNLSAVSSFLDRRSDKARPFDMAQDILFAP